MSTRLEKVSQTMKKELGHIISYDMSDPRIGFTTVTRVEVAADIKSAKVYVGIIGNEKVQKSTMAGLKHAKGFVQKEVASRLRMKYTPTLSFYLDEGPARSVSIGRLLDETTTKCEVSENEENN